MVRWNTGTEHVKIQRLIDSQDIYAVTALLVALIPFVETDSKLIVSLCSCFVPVMEG